MLTQRTFLPIFPAPPSAGQPPPAVDVVASLSTATLAAAPDVLILPSDLSPFAKPADAGVVAVNPGRLARMKAGGSYATIVVHPPAGTAAAPADGAAADGAAAEGKAMEVEPESGSIEEKLDGAADSPMAAADADAAPAEAAAEEGAAEATPAAEAAAPRHPDAMDEDEPAATPAPAAEAEAEAPKAEAVAPAPMETEAASPAPAAAEAAASSAAIAPAEASASSEPAAAEAGVFARTFVEVKRI